MFIKRNKSGKRTYISIVESFREEGKVKHRTIKSLGYEEDLKKKHPDLEKFLKEELEKARNSEDKQEPVQINLDATKAKELKNLGYAIPKKIYSQLRISDFWQNKQRQLDLPFNLNAVFSMLVLNRFINPSSVKKAFEDKDIFFEKFGFELDHCYQALDYFDKYSEELQKYLNQTVQEIIDLDLSYGKYDVTNFYYQIDKEDENQVDEEGNILKKGLRRKGPSKEHSVDPISQLGYFADKKGIPLSYNQFSGGESEKLSMLGIIDRSQKSLAIEKIITIADRGINTASNMYGLARDNGAYKHPRKSQDKDINFTEKVNGFIFGQTIRNGNKDLTDWITMQGDYREDGYTDDIVGEDEKGNEIHFIHKSRIIIQKIKVRKKDGKHYTQRRIKVKQVVYYSESYRKRSEREREKLLEKTQRLIEDESAYNAQLKRSGGIYIQSSNLAVVDGKEVKATKQERVLNEEKIEKDSKLDGYYCIVTSELDMDDLEIWRNYKELNDIEECFRTIKNEFNVRPMFVRKEEHINAKLLICFVDLLIMRILKNISNYQFSTEQISEAIKSYLAIYAGSGYYIFPKKNDIITFFDEKLDLNLLDHHMKEGQIRKALKR